jgi:hypothetical protein
MESVSQSVSHTLSINTKEAKMYCRVPSRSNLIAKDYFLNFLTG